jgi:hypothetical protein
LAIGASNGRQIQCAAQPGNSLISCSIVVK